MNRTCFLLTAVLMCQAGLLAQIQQLLPSSQQADSLSAGRGGRGVAANTVPIPRQESGRPFSATATTQTTQTLIDGTHVNQTITMRQYRDADGRVRMEPGVSPSEPPKSIVIYDPVAGATYHLDPANKTVTRQATLPAANTAVAGGGRRGGGGDAAAQNSDIAARRLQVLTEALRELEQSAATIQEARNNANHIEEDLGTLTVNGVAARGTRVTTVVPIGAIGNDKEFRSVSERWFSPDLNLLIKSVSTDPRFGTTTYELTNINRQSPDPSLFQPPADYSVISNPPIQQPPVQSASKVIEEIQVRGARRVSPETLKSLIASKVGEVYDEERIRNDFTALWKTGRFSDVQVNTEPGARGGVIVRFTVTERP